MVFERPRQLKPVFRKFAALLGRTGAEFVESCLINRVGASKLPNCCRSPLVEGVLAISDSSRRAAPSRMKAGDLLD